MSNESVLLRIEIALRDQNRILQSIAKSLENIADPTGEFRSSKQSPADPSYLHINPYTGVHL